MSSPKSIPVPVPLADVEAAMVRSALQPVREALARTEPGKAARFAAGVSASYSNAGELVVTVDTAGFALLPHGLVITGLPPLAISVPPAPDGLIYKHLTLRDSGEVVSLHLTATRPSGPGSPRRRKPGAGRSHHPATLYLPEGVQPQVVGGGLPSLGRKAK